MCKGCAAQRAGVLCVSRVSVTQLLHMCCTSLLCAYELHLFCMQILGITNSVCGERLFQYSVDRNCKFEFSAKTKLKPFLNSEYF